MGGGGGQGSVHVYNHISSQDSRRGHGGGIVGVGRVGESCI